MYQKSAERNKPYVYTECPGGRSRKYWPNITDFLCISFEKMINKTSKITILVTFFFLCFSSDLKAQKHRFPYQNPKLPVEVRVNDLLSRMSLEEKVRQMDMYHGEGFLNQKKFSKKKSVATIQKLGIGSIHDLFPENAKLINDIQRTIIKESRWGIPALVIEEMLHGYAGKGSTAFPMNIGLGATWDTDLIEHVGKVTATEARIHGVHFGLGPVLGIGREPRWGRVAETFGEDTYLSGEIGSAMIKGMQGDTLASEISVVAEPKHFAVHSIPQAGSNVSPVIVGERTAREDFLPVFEKAFKKGGALGTMVAYSELDGIPCAVNKWLLTDVLRKEWGFKGLAISDLGAIRIVKDKHFVTKTEEESIWQAIESGIDMQFYDYSNEFWQNTIISLVKKGKLSAKEIDRTAGHVLRLKFILGLFENPYVDEKFRIDNFHTPEHQKLALEAGRKSIVLLKNDQLLPLQKNKRIAVIGPNADKSLLGGYATHDKKAKTVLEGIKEVIGNTGEVFYEEGVPMIDKGQIISSEFLFTPDGKTNGLKGEYFDNKQLEGHPVLTKVDKEINFDLTESPGKGLDKHNFSVRWTGFLAPKESFNGWIGMSSDDGVRLWIDDKLVINSWKAGTTMLASAPVHFDAGKKYKIRIEYWQGGWHARTYLRWNLKKVNMQPAIDIAKRSDVAVVVLGESNDLVEENRDVATLDLYGKQKELIQAIQKTGTPVVCVLLNGRPLSINWIAENVPAIVEAWFPGEEGGRAVADVLFGDFNPGGKLPITVPRSVGQLPIYYNQKPSAIHRYVTEKNTPLYPFGFGLSYTTFSYNNVRVDNRYKEKGLVRVSVDVKNTGNYDGDEVVQLYINDMYSSVTTPRKTLKGFKRVNIKRGKTKTVIFDLSFHELSLWNREMKRVVEPGAFEVMLGGNSVDLIKTKFILK